MTERGPRREGRARNLGFFPLPGATSADTAEQQFLSSRSVLFLHPLVEEKVKEQLEAAKPEPVIEEVVSTWVASPWLHSFLL